MTEVWITDEGGDSLPLVDFGDFRSSFYGKPLSEVIELQRRIPEFVFRDDDVLVASYPKTGCTWTHELVSMIISGHPDTPVQNKMERMLEVASQTVDSLPSPRLLNTHIPFNRLPADFHRKRVRTIFLVRNPKDTAVSLYHHMCGMTHYQYEGKFCNWLPLFLRGEMTYIPYYEYLVGWEAAIRSSLDTILMIYYEDLKKDTLVEIRRIAKFLGADLSEDTMSAISAKCQFKEMKNRCDREKYGPVTFKDGSPGFFRKGDVGDWKNWFTVAQSELFDRVFSQEMEGSELKFVYTLH